MRRFVFVFTVLATIAFLIPILGAISAPAQADNPIVGEIRMYAGSVSTLPDCWALADYNQISRSTYSELFSVITTTYGIGDGSTTFNKPNLQAHFPAGAVDATIGQSNALYEYDFYLGTVSGDYFVNLSIPEIPSHDHDWWSYGQYNYAAQAGYPSGLVGIQGGSWSETFKTGQTGDIYAHKNLPPYVTVNFIIYTGVCLTPTPTPTDTPTPTATNTPTVTPTPTNTATPAPGQLSYIDAYTHTLQSNQTLLVPVSVTFGQVMIAGVLICVVAVMVFDFGHRLVYRK